MPSWKTTTLSPDTTLVKPLVITGQQQSNCGSRLFSYWVRVKSLSYMLVTHWKHLSWRTGILIFMFDLARRGCKGYQQYQRQKMPKLSYLCFKTASCIFNLYQILWKMEQSALEEKRHNRNVYLHTKISVRSLRQAMSFPCGVRDSEYTQSLGCNTLRSVETNI